MATKNITLNPKWISILTNFISYKIWKGIKQQAKPIQVLSQNPKMDAVVESLKVSNT